MEFCLIKVICMFKGSALGINLWFLMCCGKDKGQALRSIWSLKQEAYS